MDIKNRIVIKRGVGVATIPVSADHRNGDWIYTDLYEGEMYQDISTGVLYTRSAVGINAVSYISKIWKGSPEQSGTSDPTFTEGFTSLEGTITMDRSSMGVYTITSSVAEFTVDKTIMSFANALSGFVTFQRISDTVITVATFDETNTLQDNILSCTLTIEILL